MKQSVAGARYGLTIDLDAGINSYAPFTVRITVIAGTRTLNMLEF